MAKGREARRLERLMTATLEKVVGQVQLRALQAVTSATPVDTGFARAGWTPSLGSAVTERLDRPKSESEARARANRMRSENLANSSAIAKTYKLAQGKAFLSNAVPYIVHLNMGSSAQAGSKFVDRAIEAAVRSFKGRRL